MSDESQLLTDLNAAVAAGERAGTPVSLVVIAVRHARNERRRRRVEQALQAGPMYRLDDDRYAVVLVRTQGARSERRRKRILERLRTADGFVYQQREDAYVVLLPGSTPSAAYAWAVEQNEALASALIGPRMVCGVAGLCEGRGFRDMLERAADGVARAATTRAHAWMERLEPAQPLGA